MTYELRVKYRGHTLKDSVTLRLGRALLSLDAWPEQGTWASREEAEAALAVVLADPREEWEALLRVGRVVCFD